VRSRGGTEVGVCVIASMVGVAVGCGSGAIVDMAVGSVVGSGAGGCTVGLSAGSVVGVITLKVFTLPGVSVTGLINESSSGIGESPAVAVASGWGVSRLLCGSDARAR